MKAFASWSGGKDAMLAVHRFNKLENCSVDTLVNMCDETGKISRSHGVSTELIRQQANSLNIEIIQKSTTTNNYRKKLIEVIWELKKSGIEAGVFGDIFLKEHKAWIEDVCKETAIKAVFPLWKENTKDLLSEFIQTGFKSIIVAVDNAKLNNTWLGRIIDQSFLEDILQLKNIDPCAEFGEYHSFVYDGPNFDHTLLIETGKQINDGKTTFLEIK